MQNGEMDDEHPEIREEIFHNTVREYVIFLLFFVSLFLCSYFIIQHFKREEGIIYSILDDEAKAYTLTIWTCTFSLAVSLGAALLLPISILSNEILLLYPDSYYMKWLNSSLIQGLWSMIFLLSNLNLFLLLPFAYLFTEAEGFPGFQKACLPFMYSCISFCGVILLLGNLPFFIISVVANNIFFPLVCMPVDELICVQFEELAHYTHLQYDGLQHPGLFKNKSMFQIKDGCSLAQYLGYPLIMLLLLAFAGATLLLVVNNTLQLLIGIRALPATSKQFTLGITSLSALGPIGAFLELSLIGYFLLTSVVGLYSLPFFSAVRPHKDDTPIMDLLANCVLLLLLTSAIPLLTRTLGITNFDLLGQFGHVEWLGNYFIVLFSNVFFVFTLSFCLANTLTAPLRKELAFRLNTLWVFIRSLGSSPIEFKEE